jgi:hypothetical protein
MLYVSKKRSLGAESISSKESGRENKMDNEATSFEDPWLLFYCSIPNFC